MKHFFAMILALCMLCGILPASALAEDMLLEEVLLEELPELEELITEEEIPQTEPILEETLPELPEEEPLLPENNAEPAAFSLDAKDPIFHFPERIIIPATLKDIKKENMLVNYQLDTWSTGEKCLSTFYTLGGEHYDLFIWYKTDGAFSHAQISSSGAKTGSGTIAYSVYNLTEQSGFNRRGQYKELEGIYNDKEMRVSYVFAYPDGYSSECYVKYVIYTNKQSNSETTWMYRPEEGWTVLSNGQYVPVDEGPRTNLIPPLKIRFSNREIKLYTKDVFVNSNINQFVGRCYTEALNRTEEEMQADQEGVAYWYNNLKDGLISADFVGYYFIFSPEGAQKGQSNNDFVTMLYRLYMDREPDEGGLNYWDDLLNRLILTREDVNWWFCESDEWQGIKAEYGMI